MASGKRKGSQWERDISKYLTQWLTNQKAQYYFWKSPGSGSIGTISGTNPDLHGDIIPLKEESDKALCSKIVFECKNGYPKTTLDNHLKYNKEDNIYSFWSQVVYDAEKVNKYPMLIYKKKGMPTPWLGISTELYNKLKKHLENIRFLHLKWDDKLPDIYFFSFYEFFDIITPDITKRIGVKK